MKNLNMLLLTSVLAAPAAPALALSAGSGPGESNFSYSTLGFQLGKATPDEEIIFFGERYEDFGAASIGGSVQLADNFAIGGSASSISNEGPRTEISTSAVSLNFFVPIPMGDRVDLVPRIGYISTEVERCLDNVCAEEDDSALAYGIGMRLWAIPDGLELNAAFSDTNADNSKSVLSLGLAGWVNKHHRFGLDFETSDSINAVLVGYSYNW